MMVQFRFPEGKRKVLTFSYDDGSKYDKRLADIFASCGMKGTFNLSTSFLEDGRNMTPEEIKTELVGRGMEIACHGRHHPFEEQLLPASMLEDVLEDKKKLEALSGQIVRGMAYPFGTYRKDVIETLKSIGIVYSRTTQSTGKTMYFPDRDGWLEWHPTCHHGEKIADRVDAFLKNPWGLHMLYIWGHSFEFERNGNWNIIEEFCDRIKGNPDVWYATNIEIYDYMEACRSLISSSDASLVKNPSAIPVWVEAEGKTVEIDPGQTVRLR